MTKKEIADSLKRDCYKRISKDQFCRTFHNDMRVVFEASNRQDTLNQNELLDWFWQKFFMLVRVKYDIELVGSENPYYFLAKRIQQPAEEKESILNSKNWLKIPG